ncbi:MAG: ribosome maturation factor RimP [Actinobacteria bacterium]|nr:ribosome maturation factor RimP [Actinomycetota bacterium]
MAKDADRAKAVKVERIVDPVVAEAGYDLEGVTVRPAGKRTQVIVTVDADVVDSDGLAELSRGISVALDSSDAMGEQAYTLEVSSRGVATPLTLPRHWRRNVGRLVAVHMVDGTGFEARLTGADEVRATFEDRHVPYQEVERAVVQVEFGDDA